MEPKTGTIVLPRGSIMGNWGDPFLHSPRATSNREQPQQISRRESPKSSGNLSGVLYIGEQYLGN